MTEPTRKPMAVCLVRDKEGKPCLDHPLSHYPPHIRAAIEAQLTPEERIEYADR